MGRGNPPTRHNAMHMRMQPKLLTPGVQDGYHSRFGAHVFGIGSKGLDGLPGCGEQSIIHFLIKTGQEFIEMMGQSKDNMIVWNGQQFAFPIDDPSFFVDHLAFGTMPVAAGVVTDRFDPTRFTNSHMPTQGKSSAQGQCPECFPDLDRGIKTSFKPSTMKTDDIGYFIGRLQRG